jgi:hypothetical protein
MNLILKPSRLTCVLLLCLGSLASGHAVGADYPNVVGTWERVSGMRAVTGTAQHKVPAVLTPDGESGLQQIVVAGQKSGVFDGQAKLVDGEHHLIAGAFRKDAKRFVISSDIGTLSGEIAGDEMEACFTTLLTSVNIAGCYQLKKVK